jgi:predicted naringenin-chalcone synthase
VLLMLDKLQRIDTDRRFHMSHLHWSSCLEVPYSCCASSYYAPEEIDAVVSVSCSGSKNGSLWAVVHAAVSLLRS